MLYYPYPGWPYAAKAVIQYEYGPETDIDFYLTFPLAMDVTVMPSISLFTFTVNGTEGTIDIISWVDPYTLKVAASTNIAAGLVKMLYDGPSPDLRTTYKKQWEPWGYIPCLNITT